MNVLMKQTLRHIAICALIILTTACADNRSTSTDPTDSAANPPIEPAIEPPLGPSLPSSEENLAPAIQGISTGNRVRIAMGTQIPVVVSVHDEQPNGLQYEYSSAAPTVVAITPGSAGEFTLLGESLGTTTLYVKVTDSQGLATDAFIEATVFDPLGDTSTSDIIFETDFSADTGYRVTHAQGYGLRTPPTGWDSVIASTDSVVSVVSGAGENGSNAIRLAYGTQSQPTISLVKHLTGNERTGYDELYIRYNVRLPNNFFAGTDGSDMKHWKWGRLWQNTAPLGAQTETGAWTENRENSGFVVWALGTGIPYTRWSSVWAENTGTELYKGSAGGPMQSVDWFVSGANQTTQDGYFESVGDGAWAFDAKRPGYLADTQQKYHTIEFRFKLATSETAEDGIFEIWYDGVKQDQWTRIRPGSSGGAPQRNGIPTRNRGSGFNFFAFFDNMARWNRHWADESIDGYIDISDVVVSTTYIGHDYVVSGINDNTRN